MFVFNVGHPLTLHQNNSFFADFRWPRNSHTLGKKQNTHTIIIIIIKNRIIFNLTFYMMSQIPLTLHISFFVQLNCNCFLLLERVWLLNLKTFILGILVVSGEVKWVRRWRESGGFFPIVTWSFLHSLLSGARPQIFLTVVYFDYFYFPFTHKF